MPILWRYALQSYLRVFFLSVCTFIAVLILSRFTNIARFTALSGDGKKAGLFILYQVPTILPIAIPISALIASLLLFQRLSRSLELTALRASGLSFQMLLTPLLFTSLLFSLLNFSICADISPYCRRETKALVFQETSQNPLLLLQRQNLVKIKHAYLDMSVKDEETIKDLTLIAYQEMNQRLNLFSARKLRVQGDKLLGEDLALVSYLDSDKGSDVLVIENQTSMSTFAPFLSNALKKRCPRHDFNSLSLKMLRLTPKNKPASIEILRRISLSLAVFSFTLLGCAFGIEEGRNPSKKNLFKALLLTLTVLLSYLLGKELKSSPLFAVFAFLLPHPLIWICSTFHLRQISRGRL